MSEIKELDATIQRTQLQEFHEHEVYLSFRDDRHALVFEAWLFKNWPAFIDYYENYDVRDKK